jgi:hypothetical protein
MAVDYTVFLHKKIMEYLGKNEETKHIPGRKVNITTKGDIYIIDIDGKKFEFKGEIKGKFTPSQEAEINGQIQKNFSAQEKKTSVINESDIPPRINPVKATAKESTAPKLKETKEGVLAKNGRVGVLKGNAKLVVGPDKNSRNEPNEKVETSSPQLLKQNIKGTATGLKNLFSNNEDNLRPIPQVQQAKQVELKQAQAQRRFVGEAVIANLGQHAQTKYIFAEKAKAKIKNAGSNIPETMDESEIKHTLPHTSSNVASALQDLLTTSERIRREEERRLEAEAKRNAERFESKSSENNNSRPDLNIGASPSNASYPSAWSGLQNDPVYEFMKQELIYKQERTNLVRELWNQHDVMAGLNNRIAELKNISDPRAQYELQQRQAEVAALKEKYNETFGKLFDLEDRAYENLEKKFGKNNPLYMPSLKSGTVDKFFVGDEKSPLAEFQLDTKGALKGAPDIKFNKGPVNMALDLVDEKGEVNDKKKLYLHYDDKGKLTDFDTPGPIYMEVPNPQDPSKKMLKYLDLRDIGTAREADYPKDAKLFIERDGKKSYLPVNVEQFKGLYNQCEKYRGHDKGRVAAQGMQQGQLYGHQPYQGQSHNMAQPQQHYQQQMHPQPIVYFMPAPQPILLYPVQPVMQTITSVTVIGKATVSVNGSAPVKLKNQSMNFVSMPQIAQPMQAMQQYIVPSAQASTTGKHTPHKPKPDRGRKR